MIALDTNLLVHAHRRDASLHQAASVLVRELAEAPTPWAVCYHSLVEFHAVVTRHRLWEMPSSPEAAVDQVRAWRESPSLRILHDNDECLDVLHDLALHGAVSGGLIHDARIAGCCLIHGISELWTVDRDFRRFPGLRCRNPLTG